MNYKILKEKYEKKLNRPNSSIENFKESGNGELEIAVKTLKKEKEEIELILKAINKQIENCQHENTFSYNHGYHTICKDCGEELN